MPEFNPENNAIFNIISHTETKRLHVSLIHERLLAYGFNRPALDIGPLVRHDPRFAYDPQNPTVLALK
jgi:hypothetical protein